MARFSTIAILTLVFAYARSEDKCVCEELTEDYKKEVWAFLKKLTGDMPDSEGVLPGILSPLIPCGNCLDYSRKKRTVLPDVADVDSINTDDYSDELEQDSRCPAGYTRVGGRCISITKDRKKRSILSDVASINNDDYSGELVSDSRCPIGFTRVGRRCISMTNNKKKRSILPDVADVASINDYEYSDELEPDSRCPIGYRRLASRCISLLHLYK